jgi:hypothetical protein
LAAPRKIAAKLVGCLNLLFNLSEQAQRKGRASTIAADACHLCVC